MDELEEMFIHEVTVRSYLGSGAYGDTWSPESDPIPCFVDQTRKRVRDESGDEVTSETTLFVPLAHVGSFPIGSQVNVRGSTAVVISSKSWDGEDLDLPSHGEVVLT